jgi:hypothetical protein
LKVYRLYTEESYNSLPAATVPEMQRCDTAPVILQLKALGIDNIVRFSFLSPPPAANLVRGVELLFALGALDKNAHLTKPLGKTSDILETVLCGVLEPRLVCTWLQDLTSVGSVLNVSTDSHP